MNRKEKYYEIADIVIQLVYDFTYDIPDGNAADFTIEPKKADFSFFFHKTEDICQYTNQSVILDKTIMYHLLQIENGRKIAAFVYEDLYYDTVTVFSDKSKRADIYYLDETILMNRYAKGFNYLNYCCLELVFPDFDALVLHSSHVDMKGKALLFSAPSGTGKSTQADLWQQENLGRVINGDRTIIRRINGEWYACGCPMCGTSGIHLNSKEPLTAIVMLEKGMNNTITPLRGMSSFRQVYPQITSPTKFPELAEKNMSNLERLLNDIPIWFYSCTKEKEAVYILKSTIFQNMIKEVEDYAQ